MPMNSLGWLASVIGPTAPPMIPSHQIIALALVAIALAVGFVLVVKPVLWKPAQPAPDQAPMTRNRLLVAYGVIALIVGGSIVDCVRDTEHWPWSCYPMYSYMETGTTFDDYRLYGVPKSDPNTEISLFTDERYLQPFDQSRLALVLEEVIGNPHLHEGLVNCLTRYEALRRGGRHSGPELSKIRLYHVYWTLDPAGATIEKPDRKDLLDEASLSESEKS